MLTDIECYSEICRDLDMSISCPSCQGQHIRKNGKSRHGHQRFVCVSCRATFGQTDHRRINEERKQNALRHYAEGVGLRATERLVEVSHNSVMNWVRQEVAGQSLAKVDAGQVQIIEADELWSYMGQKKTGFGSGGLLIALPAKCSLGRWVIVTPEQPEHWVRRFLKASTSDTAQIIGSATTTSSPKTGTPRAKRTRTSSKA
jgi:transposase-like protein